MRNKKRFRSMIGKPRELIMNLRSKDPENIRHDPTAKKHYHSHWIVKGDTHCLCGQDISGHAFAPVTNPKWTDANCWRCQMIHEELLAEEKKNDLV